MEYQDLVVFIFSYITFVQASPRNETYIHIFNGGNITCTLCPPGTHWKDHCSPYSSTTCQPCEPGKTFNTAWGRHESCAKCRTYCRIGQIMKPNSCTPYHDTVCICWPGYYMQYDYLNQGWCWAQVKCEIGYGVKKKGSKDSQTECEKCPSSRFSNETSYTQPCLPRRNCAEEGLSWVKKGDTTADNICSDDYSTNDFTTPTVPSTTTSTIQPAPTKHDECYGQNCVLNCTMINSSKESVQSGTVLDTSTLETSTVFLIISILCNIVLLLLVGFAFWKTDLHTKLSSYCQVKTATEPPIINVDNQGVRVSHDNTVVRAGTSEEREDISHTASGSMEDPTTPTINQTERSPFIRSNPQDNQCHIAESQLRKDSSGLEKVINMLCKNLGIDWKKIMREIRGPLSETEIDNIQFTHKDYGLEELVIQSFNKWKSKNKNASIYDIVLALRKIDRLTLAEQVVDLCAEYDLPCSFVTYNIS